MTSMSVQFIGKEYTIPTDVVTYVDLVEFTNDIRDNLMRIFTRKIQNIEVIEDDNFMVSDINKEVSKFISKLLQNEIYDKTANDYLKNNKGIDLFEDTKQKALRQIISIRQEKLDVYRSGVEGAIYKKEASVTGLDFGVLTSSFTNAMIYAFMDASEETKQEKEALKVYNREIDELNKSIRVYDEQERQFIVNNFIPAIKTVFTYLSYELLDRYVVDLIRAGKFDKSALQFVDLERSNDLLKNLDLSSNKVAIIEQAFLACPFNIAVYMNAMKHEYLDNETFQTAKYFKQADKILDFLKDQLGDAEYPKYKKGNYYSAVLLGQLTGKSVEEIIKHHTAPYARAVVNEYQKLIKLIDNPAECQRVVRQWKEDDILVGEKTTKSYVNSSVGKIVTDGTWRIITEECGHSSLLNTIINFMPGTEGFATKSEFDKVLKEKLFGALEDAREKQAEFIREKREKTEIQRKIEEEAKRKKRIKTCTIIGVIVAAIIVMISMPSIIDGMKTSKEEKNVEKVIEEIASEFEQRVETQISDDIVIDYYYTETDDWDEEVWYEWDMIVRMNMLEDYRQSGSTDEKTMYEIMDNCRVVEDVFEDMNDDLNCWIEVGDARVRLDYEWGVIRYGDISSHEVFYYEEHGVDRYLHSGDTEYILEDIWDYSGYEDEEEDKTEDVVETTETSVFEQVVSVHGLNAYVPNDWRVYGQPSENLGRASIGEDEEYRHWYIAYDGEYDSFADFISSETDEVYEADDASYYEETAIDGCEEAYVYKGDAFDGTYVVDYYVVCKGHVFNIDYNCDSSDYDQVELENLLSNVDFKNFVFE